MLAPLLALAPLFQVSEALLGPCRLLGSVWAMGGRGGGRHTQTGVMRHEGHRDGRSELGGGGEGVCARPDSGAHTGATDGCWGES